MVEAKVPYNVEANSSFLATNVSVDIPEGYEILSNHGIPLLTGSYGTYIYNSSLTYLQIRNNTSLKISATCYLGVLCRRKI